MLDYLISSHYPPNIPGEALLAALEREAAASDPLNLIRLTPAEEVARETDPADRRNRS